jgi:proteasome accessory factor B
MNPSGTTSPALKSATGAACGRNRSGRSRPPLERMLRIHQALQSGGFPSAHALARDLEVSTKTIYRDVEFMRDRIQLPVAYDDRRHGFHYTQEVSAFPTLQITEGELVAILVAEKALQAYRGTMFERPLLSAFQKIAANLPETISLNLAEWDSTISFRTSVEPVVNLELLDRLARATAHREQLRLVYRKPGETDGTPRVVDPYHLANINGEWFLFAFDHLRQDLRTFAPSRIVSLNLTGERFDRPASFSLAEHLRGSFGVHSGGVPQRVVLRFAPQAADFIREKRWHPSQRLQERAGGELDLELELANLEEIQRWVLSWGGHAQVIEPAALAASVRSAARRLAAVHAEPPR